MYFSPRQEYTCIDSGGKNNSLAKSLAAFLKGNFEKTVELAKLGLHWQKNLRRKSSLNSRKCESRRERIKVFHVWRSKQGTLSNS
jgi:hypothetical protein